MTDTETLCTECGTPESDVLHQYPFGLNDRHRFASPSVSGAPTRETPDACAQLAEILRETGAPVRWVEPLAETPPAPPTAETIAFAPMPAHSFPAEPPRASLESAMHAYRREAERLRAELASLRESLAGAVERANTAEAEVERLYSGIQGLRVRESSQLFSPILTEAPQ